MTLSCLARGWSFIHSRGEPYSSQVYRIGASCSDHAASSGLPPQTLSTWLASQLPSGDVLDPELHLAHEAVRDWEARFAPPLAERRRAKRRGRGGISWCADETYVKIQGRWCHLSR